MLLLIAVASGQSVLLFSFAVHSRLLVADLQVLRPSGPLRPCWQPVRRLVSAGLSMTLLWIDAAARAEPKLRCAGDPTFPGQMSEQK